MVYGPAETPQNEEPGCRLFCLPGIGKLIPSPWGAPSVPLPFRTYPAFNIPINIAQYLSQNHITGLYVSIAISKQVTYRDLLRGLEGIQRSKGSQHLVVFHCLSQRALPKTGDANFSWYVHRRSWWRLQGWSWWRQRWPRRRPWQG